MASKTLTPTAPVPAPPPEYISTDQFADLVCASPATIRYWRHIRKGPKAFRLGRKALYDRAEVLAWIAAEKERQTGLGAA